MEKYVVTSGSITESYGCSIDVVFAVVDSWLEHKLGMTLIENPAMKGTL